MRLHYDETSDSLYIDLVDRESVESREVAEGVIADFDHAGLLVGIDIEHASRRLDLSVLETRRLPHTEFRAA